MNKTLHKQVAIALLAMAALPLLAQAEHNETIHLDEIGVTVPKDDTGYAVKNSSSATRTNTPIKEIPQSIKAVQLYLEYNPEPPFDAGSPEKAPKVVVQFLNDMFSGLVETAKQTAKREKNDLASLDNAQTF